MFQHFVKFFEIPMKFFEILWNSCIFLIFLIFWIPQIRFPLISFLFLPFPSFHSWTQISFKIILKLLYRVQFSVFSENPYSWSDVLFISFHFLELVLQLVWGGPEQNLIDYWNDLQCGGLHFCLCAPCSTISKRI